MLKEIKNLSKKMNIQHENFRNADRFFFKKQNIKK